MPYRKIPLVDGQYYHLYNRGNNRQKIFFEDKNYNFLLRRIRENLTKSADIIAYCLMPNHYHLIIKVINSENLVKGINKTFLSYTKAINTNYERTGHLFEGRYKYKIIPDNNYLLHLSRYIHLNPVRAKLVNKQELWLYSSYNAYIGKCNLSFLKPDIVLSQTTNYEDFVKSYQVEQSYFIKDILF